MPVAVRKKQILVGFGLAGGLLLGNLIFRFIDVITSPAQVAMRSPPIIRTNIIPVPADSTQKADFLQSKHKQQFRHESDKTNKTR